jgi:glycosyltransferase involved in cell wall biosynthesis
LLRWWDFIRSQVPEAILDVYYGWNVWAQESARTDTRFAAIYREVEERKTQPGINWHGRVGQPELAEAYARAQLWAYSCAWPEISCVSAMKAQIHGAMPIVVGKRNALEETVQFGEKLDVDLDDLVGQKVFIDTVIRHLKDPALFAPKREEMVAWARNTYRWDLVAMDWDGRMRADLDRKRALGRRIWIAKGRAPRRARPELASLTT